MPTDGQHRLAEKVRHRGAAQVARDVDLAESVVRSHAGGTRNPGRSSREAYTRIGVPFAAWSVAAKRPTKKSAPKPKPKPTPSRGPKVTVATGDGTLREALVTATRELAAGIDARDASRWLGVQLGALRGLVALAPPPPPTRCPSWPSLRERIEGWGAKNLPAEELAELHGLLSTFETSCAPPAGEIDLRAELGAVRTTADAWAAHPEIGPRDRAVVTSTKISAARLLARLDSRLSGVVLDPRWITFRTATIRLLFRHRACREAILAAADEFDRALISSPKPRKASTP